MSQFYCREDELRKLNKRYAGDKFECIVIYGRRRVGTTALINEFCKDKPTIFFSALNTMYILRWRSHPISWNRAMESVIESHSSDGGSHDPCRGSQ